MFKKIILFLSFFSIWANGTVALASQTEQIQTDAVNELLRLSRDRQKVQNGDNSPVIFQDVKYLKGLLEKLDWANSTDTQRKQLYTRLEDAVNDIEAYEQTEEQQIQEKKAALNDAREREQSTANKILGGVAIGTMGMAGMELASAISEKQAMEDAEQAMRAYLSTFVCRYDDGHSVRGGETNIELPGGNELLPLITEYKQLAADLKLRKEALGIMPGIESEQILDKANTGLYDDEGLEQRDGAFTSVSRALMDETSQDATDWAADKDAVQQKIKTSATVAATAAVASIAANLAINGTGKNNVTTKAETTLKEAYAILDEIIDNCNKAIAESENKNLLLISYENLNELQGHSICK